MDMGIPGNLWPEVATSTSLMDGIASGDFVVSILLVLLHFHRSFMWPGTSKIMQSLISTSTAWTKCFQSLDPGISFYRISLQGKVSVKLIKLNYQKVERRHFLRSAFSQGKFKGSMSPSLTFLLMKRILLELTGFTQRADRVLWGKAAAQLEDILSWGTPSKAATGFGLPPYDSKDQACHLPTAM